MSSLAMNGKDLPLITVGMPVKNRAWCIMRVLKAIEDIDYPKHRIKVVFVDDHSTDGMYEIIKQWAQEAEKKGFYKIEIIRERTNIPQARNLCVKHMEGKYLLFWDSDIIPPSRLLREMTEVVERSPNIGIIGADYLYDPQTGINYTPVVNKETPAVYMGFTLIRREVFVKTGMFNENLSQGEDTEFCIRAREKTNYRILRTSKPVLHLKRPEETRRPGRLRQWLRYNFTVRAKEYYVSWDSLPRFLKLRIVYWIAWPWSLILLAYSISIGLLPISITLLTYTLVPVYFIIRNRGIKGLKQCLLGNVLTGISLSYGVLKEVLFRGKSSKPLRSIYCD